MAGATTARPVRSRLFLYGTMAVALGIGALQMYHVRGGFITSYGADLFGTAWLYAMFRQGKTVLQRGRTLGAGTTALFVFVACTASELAQKLRLLPGVFDPFDILAYAVAVLACYLFERLVGPLAGDDGREPGRGAAGGREW